MAAVRRRGRGDGSDDDEDLGLPQSPPASPSTDKADNNVRKLISCLVPSVGVMFKHVIQTKIY